MSDAPAVAGLEPRTAALLAVLAAGARPGAVLYLDHPRAAVADVLLAALDIECRLLVVTGDDRHAAAVRERATADLRLSVHAQPPLPFLDDISAHRFELLVLDGAAAEVTAAALALLAPRGLAMGLAGAPPGGLDGEWLSWTDERAAACWLVARRGRPPPRRRGGRARRT